VLPLVAATVVLIGLLAAAVAHEGARAVGRARAQAAADAAALAGAGQGRAAADELAAANGSTILDYVETGTHVRVEVVDRRGERAVAEAAAGKTDPTEDLAPAMRAALARATQVLGSAVSPVALDPGGLSVQLARPVTAALTDRGAETGLCPIAGRPDWFEICAA
jgi:hypothetical protein